MVGARLGLLALLGFGLCGLIARAQAAPLVLTNTAQVLTLSNSALDTNPPVQVRGLVTFSAQGMGLFVEDETGGVFVYWTGEMPGLTSGDYVEVSGMANRGRYSNIIDNPRVRRVERGPAIKPRPVSLAEIYQGGLDAQWVQLTAVVRSQKQAAAGLELELAAPPYRLSVWIAHGEEGKPPQLEGKSVRIRGVVGTLSTDQREIVGFKLFVNRPDDVQIVGALATGSSAPPTVAVADLSNAALRTDGVGLVRVAGQVTLCWPGRALFVQDATGAIEVRLKRPGPPVPVGTALEVEGYLGPVLEPPRLEDAVVRPSGSAGLLRAVRLSAEEIRQGRHRNELVELDGTFLGAAGLASEGAILAVQSDARVLSAVLEGTPRAQLSPQIQPGCRLRLTGVFCTSGMVPRAGTAPALLLRSPEDVKVIEMASGQQSPWVQASTVVACLTGVGLLVALWYTQKQRHRTEHVLRLQANLQAEMRQGEQQLRRALEERDRIGRDLHDDIIQSIYAVGLNLEDCRRVVRQAPQHAEARLTTAIHTLNNTIRSVRGFLSGLEPKVLNGREFKTALKSLALTTGDEPTPFHIEVDPSAANNLTSVQATQLLQIAKEAMSNSLRHAQASDITVSLHSVAQGARLEIRDNGVGFELDSVSGTGHGLRNMKVRARELGAELEIVSANGQGCRILVTVPQRNANDPN